MTRKPRQIIGSDPLAAIPKDYNRYCDKIIGNGGGIFLEPETIIHVARVQADGGYVLNIPFLDSVFKDAKYSAVPYIADIVAGFSPDWGIKGVANASKMYSIVGAAGDVEQTVGAEQPAITANDANGKTRLTFNGTSHSLFTGAFAVAQPLTIILGGAQAISWTGNDSLVDGGAGSEPRIAQLGATPSVSILTGGVVANGDFSIGVDHHFRGLYNGASSVAQTDDNAETAGNVGAGTLTKITLGASALGASGWSNRKLGMDIYLTAAVDASYAAKMAAIKAFSASAYGTP